MSVRQRDYYVRDVLTYKHLETPCRWVIPRYLWNLLPLLRSSLECSTVEGNEMIYTLISLLVLFWLVGLVAHVGGGFIHFLLVAALCVFVFDLITGRQTV